jgi:hypothetical protein
MRGRSPRAPLTCPRLASAERCDPAAPPSVTQGCAPHRHAVRAEGSGGAAPERKLERGWVGQDGPERATRPGHRGSAKRRDRAGWLGRRQQPSPALERRGNTGVD